jgi:hypothetical protein
MISSRVRYKSRERTEQCATLDNYRTQVVTVVPVCSATVNNVTPRNRFDCINRRPRVEVISDRTVR